MDVVRAVVLAGGKGTRLAPLTDGTPKALVPVAGRPVIEHLFALLRRYAVERVAITAQRGSRALEARFGGGGRFGLKLAYVYEDAPLGSGGAILNAARDWSEPFLVVNGDVITDIDLTSLVALHRRRDARVTIALHRVDDPARYGVAVTDANDRITRFVEKPAAADAPSRWVNAGVWVFSPEVLPEIARDGFSRVEDDLFPRLAARPGLLYGFRHDGYWIDVGTQATYYRANMDALRSPLLHGAAHDRSFGPGTAGNGTQGPDDGAGESVMVGEGTVIGAGSTLCGPLAIGRDCVIGEGAVLRESVIWDGVTIGEHAVVERSIIASHATVAAHAAVRDGVIASGATVPAEQRPTLLR